MSAEQKARELGAKVEGGINWTWAKDFPFPDNATEFIDWLNENEYEHRGYYPANLTSNNPNLKVDGVRFR